MNKRAHVILPVELIADIDKIVGKRGRSAFFSKLAQREIMIRRQREALSEAAGAWKNEDHPELRDGATAWIDKLRALDSGRFQDLESRREGKCQ